MSYCCQTQHQLSQPLSRAKEHISHWKFPECTSHLWSCEKGSCCSAVASSIQCGLQRPALLPCIVLDSLPRVKVNGVRKIRPHFLVFNIHKGELLVLVVWNLHLPIQAAVWTDLGFLIGKVIVFSYRMLPLQSCRTMAFSAPLLGVRTSYDLVGHLSSGGAMVAWM